MKKLIIISIYLFSYVQASNNAIGFGLDFNGKHKMTDITINDDDYGNENFNVDMGYSLNYLYGPSFENGSLFDFGGGLEYQIPRDINENDAEGQFWFNSVYFSLYRKYDDSLCGIASIGLGTFNADDKYEGEGIVTLIGGLYYALGFNFIVNENYYVQGLYKTNHGKFSQLLFVGLSGLDIDYKLEYSRMSLSLIYRF